MTLRALVVDDELLARKALLRLLKNESDINVIGQCGDGASAVDTIRRSNPDIVFLDVQMPEMDGFRVVETIGADQMPVTIFVTAYDKYALEAFDANAVDYLLKPFASDRLARALRRARDRCHSRRGRLRCGVRGGTRPLACSRHTENRSCAAIRDRSSGRSAPPVRGLPSASIGCSA